MNQCVWPDCERSDEHTITDHIAPELRTMLADPRMADDYNPETGANDGIPYWERDGFELGVEDPEDDEYGGE